MAEKVISLEGVEDYKFENQKICGYGVGRKWVYQTFVVSLISATLTVTGITHPNL